jgi:NDP-sugar pyrophosphorylase family protein
MTLDAKYCGVVLAAGKGTRMHPFSDNYPKPLLPVCNKPVVQYQLEAMRDLGIRDVVMLIGHKGYQIVNTFGDGAHLGLKIRYVEQVNMLGIAHAVRQLEPHINLPFLLFLGDIFFQADDLQSMFTLFEEQNGGAVLATKEEQNPAAIRENYSITLNAEGFATRVIEKPRHTTNRLKGVGIYLFELGMFDAIRRTPRTAMRDEYELTDAIQVFIQDGFPVRPCNAVLRDVNLTTAGDLLSCNLLQAELSSQFSVSPLGLAKHADANLDRCVVGSNVSIRHGITIRSSVIFDDTEVDARVNLEHFVITPQGFVDCNHLMRAVG